MQMYLEVSPTEYMGLTSEFKKHNDSTMWNFTKTNSQIKKLQERKEICMSRSFDPLWNTSVSNAINYIWFFLCSSDLCKNILSTF